MDQRRVDDRGAAPQLGGGPCPVGVGTHHAACQHVVAEVDSFGRTRRTAGQHAYRDAGPRVGCGAGSLGRSQSRPVGIVQATRDRHGRGARRRADQRCQVVAFADDQWQLQRGDIGPGAVVAARRVDDDDGSAAQQHPEKGRHLAGPVAQQHPNVGAALGAKRSDALCHGAYLGPGDPLAVILDGGRVRLQVQYVSDALAERVTRHQRIFGLRAAPSPSELFWVANSAVPKGLPKRV